MTESINHEGLKRLVNLELSRLDLTDPIEAKRVLEGKIGAYDTDGTAISAGINSYFSTSASVAEH